MNAMHDLMMGSGDDHHRPHVPDTMDMSHMTVDQARAGGNRLTTVLNSIVNGQHSSLIAGNLVNDATHVEPMSVFVRDVVQPRFSYSSRPTGIFDHGGYGEVSDSGF